MPANIEIPHTGNKTVDWAVHSAAVNIIQKALIGFIALFVPVLAWGIAEMWSINREAIKEIKDAANRVGIISSDRNVRIDQKLDLIAASLVDLKILQRDLDVLRQTVTVNFDAQGRRIDHNDQQIEGLRKELYDRFVPPGRGPR